MSSSLKWLENYKVKPQAIKQVIVHQSGNLKRLAHTKVRNEVSGSTRKIYRQKGTGNARAGSIRSPIRVGGGCVHGPRNHMITNKSNKKANLAVRLDILRRHFEANNILIHDINMPIISTKSAQLILNTLKINKERVVIINHEDNFIVKCSFKNLYNVNVNNIDNISAMNIINAHKIIMTPQTVALLTEKYGVK